MGQELGEAVPAGVPTLGVLRRYAAAALLGVVVLVGLALRLQGLDWDAGHLFHPDERAILMKVASDISLPLPITDWSVLLQPNSPLNPHWFPYGTFPLYLLKIVGHLLSLVTKPYDLYELRFVGRVMSALFDAGTILLVALLGAKLYGRATGLLAAAFVSFAVLSIQLSHFFAVDVILVFFVTLAVYFCVDLSRNGRVRSAVFCGIAIGLALATKVSMAPLFLTPAVAVLLYASNADGPPSIPPCTGGRKGGTGPREDESHNSQWQSPNSQSAIMSTGGKAPASYAGISNWHHFSVPRLNRAVLLLVIVGGVAGLTFFLAEPYAVIDSQTFLSSVGEQSEMVRRIRDYPYTRQYVNTPAFIYQIQQLGTWGLGLPLGIVAWAGLVFGLVVAFWRRRPAEILILSFVVPYFALTGSFEVKFLRYLLPMVPFLALLGAEMLLALHRSAREWPGQASKRIISLLPRLVEVAISLVVLSSLFYATAYVHLYDNVHPAEAMSRWINANVPKGSRIATEHWEEGLPDLADYKHGELPLYEDDTTAKQQRIIQELQTADYIAFYSNRLYGTIPRLTDRYPLTTRYYQALFGEKLGFRLVRAETAYPNLFGITLADDTFTRPGLPTPSELQGFKPSPVVVNGGFADESFTVYDHPKVLLFKKVDPLPDARLRELLGPPAALKAPDLPAQKSGLLLSQNDREIDAKGGTWSAIFNRNSLANRFPMLTWLIIVELIALVTLPLGLVVFSALPDRGFLLIKSLSILAVTYLTWLFVSARLLTFSWQAILVALGLVGLASALSLCRRGDSIFSFLRQNWRLLVIGEAVFLLAFLAFYAVRLLNPDLWHPYRGGEKPMDFAYLNATIKSTYFPPYDPWFAGGYLNYYYFGQIIIATLIRLTGVVPAVSYNLAVPLLFALTAAGCFSVGYNLLARRENRENTEARPRRLPVFPIAGGLLAALFVTTLGNMDGLYQLIEGLWRANTLNLSSNLPGLAGLANGLNGLWEIAVNGRPWPPFDFWRSSRMMPPTFNITEFPYFTFLFADLHAHLIALPFTVLAIGLALAAVFGAGRSWLSLNQGAEAGSETGLAGQTGRSIMVLTLLALTLGALRTTNSWDFPTYLALGAAAVAIGEFIRRRQVSPGFIFWVGVKVLFLFLLSSFLFRSFFSSYELFYSGVQENKERTLIEQYLSIYALPLFLAISYLIYDLARTQHRSLIVRLGKTLGRHWDNLPRLLHLYRRHRQLKASFQLSSLGGLLVVVGLGVIAIATTPMIAFVLVMIGLVAAVLIGYLRRLDPGTTPKVFALLLLGLALSLGLGVEMVTIQGDIGRMNTVFKFYLQAWVLFGIFAAYALVYLFNAFTSPRPDRKGDRPAEGWSRRIWWAGLVVLLFACAIYPAAATRVRVEDRFTSLPPTADGMAFMRSAIYQDEKGPIDLASDYEAITWLQDNVVGSPTIVEGLTPLYRWGSRVSVYTGLPDVVGWDWHQKQQRWGYQWTVDVRLADVNQIFTTPDPQVALTLLRQYGVSYIYVGDVERLYYPGPGVAKFDQMVGRDLDLVFSNPHVKIYHVKS